MNFRDMLTHLYAQDIVRMAFITSNFLSKRGIMVVVWLKFSTTDNDQTKRFAQYVL